MKAIEINGEIKTFSKVPKNWTDSNGTYFNIGDGYAIGFKNVVTPEYNHLTEELSEIKLIDRVYTYDVIEKEITETLEELKEQKINKLKYIAEKKLSQTDWYIIREADSGESTPQSIKTERAALRTKSHLIEAEINALTTKKSVVLFDINI
jgi:hypothetical protein